MLPVPVDVSYLDQELRRVRARRRTRRAEFRGSSYRARSSDKCDFRPSITFAFVATHNHFVLDRGGKVFKQSAPIIKLPETATEEDHLALLAYLNSSTACFWMKQVFQPKDQPRATISVTPILPENNRYEFAGTQMKQRSCRCLVRPRRSCESPKSSGDRQLSIRVATR
ncbi:MAG: hypothetical protein H6720_22075 [Sandaracinus sp.]|nr:hypothetical protein [Sandaracinus sp.]